MGISPLRSRLYRRTGWAVICAVLAFAATGQAQLPTRENKSKGPRATALLQLPQNGKPRLIPICIMIDGRFFDAGIYKADPVPMALEGGTVYEAQRTGQPIGLFTVKSVLQQQQTKAWVAEGEWEAAGAAPKKPTALQVESKPREEEDRPPTLRRPSKASPENKPAKPTETKPAENKTAAPTTGGTTSGPAITPSPSGGTAGTTPSTASSSPGTTSSTTPSAAPGSSTSGSAPASAPEEQDPNAPRLRRGIPPKTPPVAATKKPTTAAQKTTATTTSMPTTATKPAVPAVSNAPKPTTQLIPAISDAGGPEPRPYAYEMKPEEEQVFRKKMMILATEEIAKQAKQFEPVGEPTGTSSRKARPREKPLSPTFSDVSLHVFDVATNNEPIIVLSAKATPAPQPGKEAAEPAREYYVTLVARSDYNNTLRKLFSAVTDDKHLDVAPRMELIDAVDADGDGRGELLFREISDAGSAYVVYRVTPDQLWALFEGTPSGQ